jgi:hypothetical protein
MKTAKTYYRLAIAVAVATVLFLLFGMGALGIIGAGGRPDLMYLGVIAVAVVGSVAARFRPRGMALALAATALATCLVAVIALIAGLQHEEGASVIEILGLTAMYAGLFAASAWLFWRAAELESPVSVGSTA